MSIYAHVLGGQICEPLFTPPEGVPIADCFNAALVWVDVTNVSPQPAEGWSAVQAGGVWMFAPTEPPVVPPETQATAELASRVAQGIAITSTGGVPFATVAFALDPTTMDQIGAVARDDAAGLGLPGGAASFTYPDAAGAPHPLTGAQVQALYRAQRDLLYVLTTQAAILAHGGAPAWPVQSATIP